MNTMTIKVSGVTFEGRQEYLAQLRGDEPCRIVPEPENKWDKNALAVHIALPSGKVAHCGFVPKSLAAQIAPLLEGESLMVSIDAITGGFELGDGSLTNLGLVLRVEVPGSKPSVVYDSDGQYYDASEHADDSDLPF